MSAFLSDEIRVCDLHGLLLDWVASCTEGDAATRDPAQWLAAHDQGHFRYGSNAAQGIHIIIRENITWDGQAATLRRVKGGLGTFSEYGSNIVVAGLRALIASRLGHIVRDIPDEILGRAGA